VTRPAAPLLAASASGSRSWPRAWLHPAVRTPPRRRRNRRPGSRGHEGRAGDELGRRSHGPLRLPEREGLAAQLPYRSVQRRAHALGRRRRDLLGVRRRHLLGGQGGRSAGAPLRRGVVPPLLPRHLTLSRSDASRTRRRPGGSRLRPRIPGRERLVQRPDRHGSDEKSRPGRVRGPFRRGFVVLGARAGAGRDGVRPRRPGGRHPGPGLLRGRRLAHPRRRRLRRQGASHRHSRNPSVVRPSARRRAPSREGAS